MNFDLIFGVLEQALKLWNAKEADRYLVKVMKLKRQWHEEYNKPLDQRSHDKLDDIELQLQLICEAFVETAKTKNIGN